jgi:peptidoglycan pentaglycine glycine transferase (the first glycine)
MEPFIGSAQDWNQLISRLPHPHLLQTWEWSQVKGKFGWIALPFVWKSIDNGVPSAAAMVLKRTVSVAGLAPKLNVLYIPKGPNLDWYNASLRHHVLEDLQAFAKRQGAIFIKLDPDVLVGEGVPGTDKASEEKVGYEILNELKRSGWSFSQDQIQFRNTVLVDLSPSEDEMLTRMKQKSRYNVRLAEKKGVKIRAAHADDLTQLYRMYADTSVRDGFLIRDEDYYQTVWRTFQTGLIDHPSGDIPFSEPLIAEVDGVAVAAISVFYFGKHAYYIYGMSLDAHRDKMPNYLLQWEAMRRARARGCTDYNLWGAPNEFNDHDSLWGVFRFKEGLGGTVVRTIGAWDYPSRRIFYGLYTQILPKILAVTRMRGKAKTRLALGGA